MSNRYVSFVGGRDSAGTLDEIWNVERLYSVTLGVNVLSQFLLVSDCTKSWMFERKRVAGWCRCDKRRSERSLCRSDALPPNSIATQ